MIQQNFYRGNMRFSDKVLALDYILIFFILLLGIISFFAMYSTEQGKFGYYTQNHLYRFVVFFILFITIAFFKIQFWFKTAYLFYFIVLILLFAVDFFGIPFEKRLCRVEMHLTLMGSDFDNKRPSYSQFNGVDIEEYGEIVFLISKHSFYMFSYI